MNSDVYEMRIIEAGQLYGQIIHFKANTYNTETTMRICESDVHICSVWVSLPEIRLV